MKKTKFVETPTSYAPPVMRVVCLSMMRGVMQQISAIDIHEAGEEIDDIFGE